VSIEQRETLDAILRQSAFPAGSDVNEQRRLLRELLSAQPLPADVTVTAAALGGVATAEITVDGIEARHRHVGERRRTWGSVRWLPAVSRSGCARHSPSPTCSSSRLARSR
jgi:hypothetical protein